MEHSLLEAGNGLFPRDGVVDNGLGIPCGLELRDLEVLVRLVDGCERDGVSLARLKALEVARSCPPLPLTSLSSGTK